MRAMTAILPLALGAALAFPCAAQQASVNELVPGPVNPAITSSTVGSAASATSTSARSLALDSASLTSISTYLATPYGTPVPAAPGYAASTSVAVPVLNPAAPTLQSTIGTIETGSATSAPPAGTGRPLNMAPVGVALNSDLRGPVVVATHTPPPAQAMGAGPAPAPAPRAAARNTVRAVEPSARMRADRG